MNINYFLKPLGKDNIIKLFLFHPNQLEVEIDGSPLPFNTSKVYELKMSGLQKKNKRNWVTFSYELCSVLFV